MKESNYFENSKLKICEGIKLQLERLVKKLLNIMNLCSKEIFSSELPNLLLILKQTIFFKYFSEKYTGKFELSFLNFFFDLWISIIIIKK